MSNANVGKLKKKAADFEQKKQFDRALSLYIQILEEAGRDLDDADLQLFNRVGDLLQRQGNVSEALAYYEKAVDVYAERGFLNNAIALCNKILRQSPARTAVYYKLGKISASKGFKSDAKKNFLEYADRMQKAGHVDEAFRALKEFADLCPDQDDIRLMLAEWLHKENRKSEAVEQLETLYNKLEAEGRSAEARATIDRIKAIDPDVVPRPSGAFIAQKSNDLVFLDLDAAQPPAARANGDAASHQAAVVVTPTPETSRIPALDGLIITFDPDAEGDATGGEASPSIDGFEATIDDADAQNAALSSAGADVDGLERNGADAESTDDSGESLLSQTVEAWSATADPIPLLDGLEVPRVSLSGAHPALSPLLDEPPMSGREFATLDLDVVPAFPTEEGASSRNEHDLALPSSLPLLLPDEAAIDLLSVLNTPLNSAVLSNAVDDGPVGPIDLLSLPPVGDVTSAELHASAVTGSPSPIDLDALQTGASLALGSPDEPRQGEIPSGAELRSEFSEFAELSVDEIDAGDAVLEVGEATVDSVAEPVLLGEGEPSDVEEGRDAVERSVDVDTVTSDVDEATSDVVERAPRDTAELVAQDGSARTTDEILAVPSEQIDEETKRSLRLEFALQGDETPDAWVEAALSAPRDDLALDRLLTPMGVPALAEDDAHAIAADEPNAVAEHAADARDASPATGASADSAQYQSGEEDRGEPTEGVAAGDSLPAIDDLRSISDAAYDASGEGRDINLLDELTAPFMRHDAAGEDRDAEPVDASASALNVEALRALVEGRDGVVQEGEGNADTTDVDIAFREESVELPLLEVEEGSGQEVDLHVVPFEVEEGDTSDFLPHAGDIDDALPDRDAATSRDFAESGEVSSDEAGAAEDAEHVPEPAASEWPDDEAPEVLIDGEWRDEHMGDLISGEVRAIGARRDEATPRSTMRFDDLAAATMWVAPDGEAPHSPSGRMSNSSSGDGFFARMHTPRSTLSFGGVEAQLRRRLELDPGNVELRRQLGEALLDQGDREAGLAELDVAMRAFEQLGNLDGARGVADVVLRVVPASVLHHQKRVEYAVRANDRVRLVEAYVELADALFRSGDPEKARVVYGRVLELSPTNGRARFALGLLTTDGESAVDDASDPSAAAGTESETSVTALFERVATPVAGDEIGSPAQGTLEQPAAAEQSPAVARTAEEARDSEPVAALEGAFEVVDAPVAESLDGASLPGPTAPSLDEQIDAAFATPSVAEPAIALGAAERGEGARADGETREETSTGTAYDSSPMTDGDFIDLGEWLRDDEPVRSTRMVTVESPPTGNEQADFDDMLRRFKQGVAANLDEEDYASHYDLGVAYKEMGLVDEAIAEFQKSLRGDTHRVRSYEALGQCFVEKGQLQVAVTLLRRALETTGADDQKLVGVLYLLGYASEVMARHADALGYYQRVFAVDIEFRDVAQRVAAMEHVTQ